MLAPDYEKAKRGRIVTRFAYKFRKEECGSENDGVNICFVCFSFCRWRSLEWLRFVPREWIALLQPVGSKTPVCRRGQAGYGVW
jgi:hypothetical protein